MSLRLRLTNNLSLTGGSSAFDPATLFGGTGGGFYDPSDMSTLFQDSAGTTPVTGTGQPVGKMLDLSGNGNHLTQATAAARPTYTESGGLKYLVFDGVDDQMASALTMAQPWDRVSAFTKNTLAASSFVFSGGTGDIGCMYQDTGTTLALYDNTAVACQRTIAATTDYVATERHDGANSRLALDNNAYATGNPGTTTTGTMIVGKGASASGYSNMKLFGHLQIARALTDPEIAQLRTWFAAKQGRVL